MPPARDDDAPGTQTAILDHWWPVTQDLGLIRAGIDSIAATRPQMYEAAGLPVRTTWLHQPLADCLAALEPLSPAPTIELFLATASGWTVYLANGCRGSDPFLPMVQLSRALGVTALRRCVTAPAMRWQGVILEVYDTPAAGGDADGHRRSIAAVNDGGRWVFDQSGSPYPFEDTARFAARRVRDRFTPEMLASCLAQLGAPTLTDALLQPNGRSHGLLIARAAHAHLPAYSLDQAKALHEPRPA
jgi:hypothetical protein